MKRFYFAVGRDESKLRATPEYVLGRNRPLVLPQVVELGLMQVGDNTAAKILDPLRIAEKAPGPAAVIAREPSGECVGQVGMLAPKLLEESVDALTAEIATRQWFAVCPRRTQREPRLQAVDDLLGVGEAVLGEPDAIPGELDHGAVLERHPEGAAAIHRGHEGALDLVLVVAEGARLAAQGRLGVALLPRRVAAGPSPEGPLAFLHGDLVAANVLWPPEGPVLVDWEFARMGDPAEDLAYLAELNELPGAVHGAVLAGYDAPGVAARVDGWRGLVAADAGGWYLAHGMAQEADRMLARARGRATPA